MHNIDNFKIKRLIIVVTERRNFKEKWRCNSKDLI